MRKALIIIATAAMAVIGVRYAAGWQTVSATFHGYNGDTRIWVDEITTEKGKIEDRIDAAGNKPDREATLLPGTTTGEIFTETANGLKCHSVVVKGDYVNIYDGEGMTGMVVVEEPPLVFDPTIPSHYGMLLGRYSVTRGGSQKIAVIVPEKGDYCKIEISPRPAASIPVGDGQKESKVYQFRVEFNQYATVWTLEDAVAAIYLPWKDETMVDAKYPLLHQKIQMLIKRSM